MNIGTRQKSRIRGDNVIDVNYDKNNIIKAVKKCIFDNDFIKVVKKQKPLRKRTSR